MNSNKIGAVIVLDPKDHKMSGIFSERDYLSKVIAKGLDHHKVLVSDIMSKDVVCVESDTGASKCLSIMNKKGIRHIPVIEAGRILGMLSIGDIVKHLISEQKSEISYLRSNLGFPVDMDQGL
eukprot:gene2819-3504_t